ncbi:hypothetical protein BAE44_0020523 [Dichanthelium oligosanthes]|uniref:Bifunctional inhibitor/plant lipid transfer protein/seed storage helical domain-containing protein n=1 Tax=Dichanthelium oligosanthes TaxID=888268 RepID=A0A1E5V000_9POAL|nr:hypothetical protein BAE44_0020523 [Dichanthelium oligosanthes]
MFTTHKAWGDQDCYTEKRNVLTVCEQTIKNIGDYIPPSNICRNVVRGSDMACVCRKLNHEDERTISAIKLVHLASDCGKPLTVGSECGNKLDSAATTATSTKGISMSLQR